MSLHEEIRDLTRSYTEAWWGSETSFPRFERAYTSADLPRNDRELERITTLVLREMERMPADAEGQAGVRERLLGQVKPFLRMTLGLEEGHLDLILRRRLIDVAAQFAREAHHYDPSLTDEDIYQASRNVMSMNFMQLLLGLPVKLTPAVFAYSLLYPYSDNILDDPGISMAEKAAFGAWFRAVLEDEDPEPRTDRERRIREMIALVEGQFPRAKFPAVYESMTGIHAAQERSLALMRGKRSPYEGDVLGLSFEKGGASVLGDGYLVAGELNDWQRRFMFGYGCFTQLMDDVEDIEADMRGGIMTVFSQSAGHWKLDGVTNRLFHFGEAVFSQMERFPGGDAATLRGLVWTCIQPALIGSLIRSHRYYSRDHLASLQQHFPFHFRTMDRQQRKLRSRRFSIVRLVEATGTAQPTGEYLFS